MSDFSNKIVLITGATSGIGAAAARAFAREGGTVIVNGRREQEGQQVVDSIISQGGSAEFMQADVSVEAEVEAMIDAIVERHGRLDVAFNNAGVEGLMGKRINEQTLESYQQIMDINVVGVLWAMKYEITAMLVSGGGSIVNTASIFSRIGMPGMSIYTASKHAVVGLTRAAAIEYAKDGIRVNALSPGGVETAMIERGVGTPEEVTEGRKFFEEFHPMGRLSRPEEQAEAALFLASDKASFVNGANFAVDSGWSVF